MSGNLWMFSDKLDDEDIEIMKHEFITYYQGADYYGLGLKMFTRLAHEAGAVYKIGKKVLIRRTIFDEYLRQQYHIEQMASLAADGKEASTRQGTLVLDTDSGRMNIRFGFCAIPHLSPFLWAAPKPRVPCSNPGAEWLVPNCCSLS